MVPFCFGELIVLQFCCLCGVEFIHNSADAVDMDICHIVSGVQRLTFFGKWSAGAGSDAGLKTARRTLGKFLRKLCYRFTVVKVDIVFSGEEIEVSGIGAAELFGELFDPVLALKLSMYPIEFVVFHFE